MTKIAYLRASQNYTNWGSRSTSSPPVTSSSSSSVQIGTVPINPNGPSQQNHLLSSPTRRGFAQPTPAVGGFFPGAQQGLQFQTPAVVPRGCQQRSGSSNNNVPKPMIMTPTTRFNSNPTVIFDDQTDGGRISKPLMEKRRRARINQCLSQLKTIVVDSAGQHTENNKCKLEKADILELTVKYVKMLYQNSISTDGATVKSNTPPSESDQMYLTGYSDCIQQVFHYVDQELPEIKESHRESLSAHLSHCMVVQKQSQSSSLSQSQSQVATATTESKPIFCTPPSPAPSSESSLDQSSIGSNSPVLSKCSSSSLSLENATSIIIGNHQSNQQLLRCPPLNTMEESLESYHYYDDEDEIDEEEEELEDSEESNFQIRTNLPLNLKISENSYHEIRKRPRLDLETLEDDEEVWRPW